MQKTDPVVIVGGGFAGISTAHSVLRNIKPTPKVILVSASKQFYYKVSAPRALVRPDLVPIDQITPDIQQAFAHYPDGKFEFMYAYARAVDTDVRNLIVESVEHPGSRKTVRYAALVVATGGKSLDPLWSPAGPVDDTKERMAAVHEKIVNAESIVVVGGGSLGIEVAGELGSEYGRKKAIALYSGGPSLLTGYRRDLGGDAEDHLNKMGVRVVHDVKLYEEGVEEETGKTILKAKGETNGVETIKCDVYIATTGLKPNTEFMPKDLLNNRGRLEVDEYLHVKGSTSIYAIGFPATYSRGVIVDINDAVPTLTKAIKYDLQQNRWRKPKKFRRQEKDIIIIPVGRRKGVGLLYGWKVPSFVVWLIKGRGYFVGWVPYYLNGSAFKSKAAAWFEMLF